jgi:hypothetical protein
LKPPRLTDLGANRSEGPLYALIAAACARLLVLSDGYELEKYT